MGNDYARKGMWDSSYRPEQIFVRDFLAKLYPKSTIKLEYPINNLYFEGKPTKPCTLDIAIIDKKWAIRLNGGYHFSSGRQELKDEIQKHALEGAGWNVLDFDHFKMINVFKKKKTKATVKLAEEEVLKYLGKMSYL